MALLLDAIRATVRALATRLLDWAAPPPAPVALRVVGRSGGPCARLGPPLVGGGPGFLCTLDAGHDGAHEARVDGDRVGSWTGAP